jgi:hypothetical protein
MHVAAFSLFAFHAMYTLAVRGSALRFLDWAVIACSVVDRGNINSAHHDMSAVYRIVVLLYVLCIAVIVL